MVHTREPSLLVFLTPDSNKSLSFLDHPWSKLPATFLNLEGAGNGGYVQPYILGRVLTFSNLVVPCCSVHRRWMLLRPSVLCPDPTVPRFHPTPLNENSSALEPTSPYMKKPECVAWTWLSIVKGA